VRCDITRRKHYIYYDDNFKAKAVSLSEIPGVLAKHVAEALDIHKIMLYRWLMEMRRGQIIAKNSQIKEVIDKKPEISSIIKSGSRICCAQIP
jgi:transposase-like protein